MSDLGLETWLVYGYFHTITKLSLFFYIFHINRQASEIVYPTETGHVFLKSNLYVFIFSSKCKMQTEMLFEWFI